MEKNDIKDKLLSELFKTVKPAKPSVDFTNKVMQNILPEVETSKALEITLWKRTSFLMIVLSVFLLVLPMVVFRYFNIQLFTFSENSYLLLVFNQTYDLLLSMFHTIKISTTAIIILCSVGALLLIEPVVRRLHFIKNLNLSF